MVSVQRLYNSALRSPNGARLTGESPASRRHFPHAPIAQLDRASDYESEGRVFESPWAHLKFRLMATPSLTGALTGSAFGTSVARGNDSRVVRSSKTRRTV